MSVTTALQDAPTQAEERTWRVNLEAPRGQAYTMQIYRERWLLVAYCDQKAAPIET